MPQLATKPLAFFKTNPQVRKSFEEAGLLRLGESLKIKQLQPVLCQPDGTLIAGERRYRAAKLVGLATLEVKIADEPLSDAQIRLWQLVENMLREDLKPIEQVDGLEELARLNTAMNNRELAGLLNIDPSMVTRLRSVARCIPAVREALAEGTIGISDAYAISKYSEPEMASVLELKLSGASRDAIERAGRKSCKVTAAVVKVTRIKCKVPGRDAMVVVSGAALSLDDMITVMTDLLRLAKRESEKGLDARTFERVCSDLAKKV